MGGGSPAGARLARDGIDGDAIATPDQARRMSVVARIARACGIGLVAALWLASSVAFAQAPAWEAGTDGLLPIPPLSAHVTDLTQTLAPAERQALEAKLVDWEARTGNQLAVLMVPTTQPEPIEAYSLRVAEKWQIGRKGKDNGVLFLVAKNDKKMRFEVGYGLEGTLTDVTARRIIAENVAPMFREGKFGAGIDAGVERVIAVVAEGKPLPPPKAANTHRGGGFDIGTLLLVLFIAVPIVGGILRSIFGKVLGSTVGAGIVGVGAWLVIGSLVVAGIAAVVAFVVMIFAGAGVGAAMGRRGGGVFIPTGGGWGGGGFGGGGGGFSGGGGSFGGGGASGGWD
jgi:uncharacterized protein